MDAVKMTTVCWLITKSNTFIRHVIIQFSVNIKILMNAALNWGFIREECPVPTNLDISVISKFIPRSYMVTSRKLS